MGNMYDKPLAEMATDLGDRDSFRAYGDRRPADWPEALYRESGSAFLADYYR
jgi:hypothetical protein